MANIIHVENKHKTGLKNKKVITIAFVLALVFGVGGYVAYKYYMQGGKEAATVNQDKLATLRKTYDESKAAALANPEDVGKQAAVSDAKGALANEYLAKKDYSSAEATLNDGGTSLQSMQAEAIIAEQKGDYKAAIDALNRQIEYFKALPATDTDYNYEIRSVERKIAQLQGGL